MLNVDDAILSRRSVRAFRPDPVSQETVTHILEVSSRAPSGTNTQPWKVHVLTGNSLKRVSESVLTAFREEPATHTNDRPHYTEK